MLKRERKGKVEILTINRPEARNSINTETNTALANAFDEISKSTEVNAVILTGAGDKSFCAGVDLKEVDKMGNEDAFRESNGGFAGLIKRDMPQVVIAAVNGYAIGGGLEIMLACDLVVAADSATFASPEAYLGILADGGAMVRLPRQLPLAVAKEILLLGERFGASRAYELGLVNRVVPLNDLMSSALEMAERASEGAPISMQLTKKMIAQGRHLSWEEAWELNDACAQEIEETQDSFEGPRAFSEKRRPTYRGT